MAREIQTKSSYLNVFVEGQLQEKTFKDSCDFLAKIWKLMPALSILTKRPVKRTGTRGLESLLRWQTDTKWLRSRNRPLKKTGLDIHPDWSNMWETVPKKEKFISTAATKMSRSIYSSDNRPTQTNKRSYVLVMISHILSHSWCLFH